MGSAERIRVSAGIAAAERANRPVAIVVSAMSKVTDLLLETLRQAENGNRAAVDANVAGLRERHETTARELLTSPDAVVAGIGVLVGEFERIAQGMLLLGDRPPRSVDEAVAIGERLTALIIAAYLTETGTPAEAVNAAQVVVTDSVFGNATPIMSATRVRAAEVILPLLAAGKIAVMTGPMASRRLWGGAAPISPRRFWRARWMRKSFGSGPTSMAS